MTLTRFLRKYIYFPMGGSKKGKVRTYVNIFVVFIISGLWHGANWTFVLWGFVHGCANVLNRIFARTWNKFHVIFRWIGTFPFVSLSWLIFRCDSIEQLSYLVNRIVNMDSFVISTDMLKCFVIPEFIFIRGVIIALGGGGHLIDEFGIYVFLVLAMFGVLKGRNCNEKSSNVLGIMRC